MILTFFAAATDDDKVAVVFILIFFRWTNALEAIQLVDTRAVIETRRNTVRCHTLVYVCPTSS